MFCWLAWEDTELGRPCWDTKKARRKRQQQQSYEETIAHQSSSWHYLVGVRNRLTSHATTLPSLGHWWDAVRGERFRLAMSTMRLHHRVSIILLLLLLLLLATRCSWEVGATTAGLDGSKGRRERHRKGWLYLSLDTLLNRRGDRWMWCYCRGWSQTSCAVQTWFFHIYLTPFTALSKPINMMKMKW